ncbi:enoyl-CoA hydratase/isomerase family protein [Amycolatopsis pigmentata]|uniref:Enoyl-CoA hydratase/isomerase family protein n=1 Tax=Amycolatopsis pigmentata TaxID=450801 RepID=A0ABW5G4S6_9PSEU
MTADSFRVETTTAGPVEVLTMCGKRGNTLSAQAFGALEDALRTAMSTASVAGVVLTGSGRVFSVGADLAAGPTALSDLIAADGGERPGWLEPAGRVTTLLRSGPVPVVAAVNGDAVGGGATLTLGADVRIAARGVRFGFGFGKVGVVPEGGSTWLLPRLVGLSRATEWMLTGRVIAAEEARDAGLVTEVGEPAALIERAVEMARAIGLGTSPRARWETLRLLADGQEGSFGESRRRESEVMRSLAGSRDAAEGMTAFVERRAPRFGRLEGA